MRLVLLTTVFAQSRHSVTDIYRLLLSITVVPFSYYCCRTMHCSAKYDMSHQLVFAQLYHLVTDDMFLESFLNFANSHGC